MYCRNCGHRGQTQSTVRGSIVLEIVLWICFIVPGLIYSVWRYTSRHQICSACHSDKVIPLDAPAAQSQMQGNSGRDESDTRLCPYCAETIKKSAIVCKHCNRDIPPSQTPPATTSSDPLMAAKPEAITPLCEGSFPEVTM